MNEAERTQLGVALAMVLCKLDGVIAYLVETGANKGRLYDLMIAQAGQFASIRPVLEDALRDQYLGRHAASRWMQ